MTFSIAVIFLGFMVAAEARTNVDNREASALKYWRDNFGSTDAMPKMLGDRILEGNNHKELWEYYMKVKQVNSRHRVSRFDFSPADGPQDPKLFVLEKNLHPGQVLNLAFNETPPDSYFLPRHLSQNIPLSTQKLPEVMRMFKVDPSSPMAECMKKTVRECEGEGKLHGEKVQCVTSIESMVEFAKKMLRANNVKPLVTEEEAKGEYTISSLNKYPKGVACHDFDYPYAVFYCHYFDDAYPLNVALRSTGDPKKELRLAMECHTDTKDWDARDPTWAALHTKPGAEGLLVVAQGIDNIKPPPLKYGTDNFGTNVDSINPKGEEPPPLKYWRDNFGSADAMPKMLRNRILEDKNADKQVWEYLKVKQVNRDRMGSKFAFSPADGPQDPKLFVLERNLHPGQALNLAFNETIPDSYFLPRHLLQKIRLSTEKLPEVMKMLKVDPSSPMAECMKKTVRECEGEGKLHGEKVQCVTSIESMVEFAKRMLKANNVRPLVTEEEAKGEYTISSLKKYSKGVACHDFDYPYAVFYCHYFDESYPLNVALRSTEDPKKELQCAMECHTDTKEWDAGDPTWAVLHSKPGAEGLCHYITPYNHILWTSADNNN